MYGAIVGDIIGSVYERHNTDKYNFPLYKLWGHRHSRFTDDSVLTIATASTMLKNKDASSLDVDDFAAEYKDFHKRFPHRGYGRGFTAWTKEPDGMYGDSYGNGSAMRVSPVGWVSNNIDRVMELAEISAYCSHGHEEGIKGAQAIAGAICVARTTHSKENVERFITDNFDYDLSATVQDLIPHSSFAACQATVPPSIRAFLESDSYEDAIRRAIVMGGDSDTIAAMTGSIAEAYYDGVPARLRSIAYLLLPISMRKVVTQFRITYGLP
jgi:ADP-ribosylglycohydrolase